MDQFIIIASDGVWEVMSSGEAVGYCIELIQQNKILNKEPPNNNVAMELTKLCRNRWDQKNAQKKKAFIAKLDEKAKEKFLQRKEEHYGICDDITVIIALFKFK